MATAGSWTGPFLRLSYRAGPDSLLAGMARGQLGPSIRLWLQVGPNPVETLLTVPYDDESARYAIELWGWPGEPAALRAALDPSGQASFDRGALVAAPSLITGNADDFLPETLAGKFLNDV